MVELTINDKQVEVPKNYTVLQACKDLNIEIPTLCYNEVLEPHGACRLCIVEVEGFDNLPASCTLQVENGMEIHTHSERVMEIRKNILGLLIADHPLNCLTCEQSGNCKLQDYCYEYDVEGPIFGTNEKEKLEIKDKNPFIEYDPNKCILCGRCVKVDQEIQCSDTLEFSQRGHKTLVSTAYEQDLSGEYSDCVFCGQCVEVCPTGALIYKPSKRQGREFDIDKKVQTTCPYCGVGCQLELEIKDNEVVKVGSVYKDGIPNSAGEACIKGRFGYQFISHDDRLTNPLIKRDGEFEEASWDEALDYIAENLSEVKEEYGSQAVGNLTSARCTNEENYLIQKFMRAVIGTNNVDHCAHL
ncbi:putative molibdopterin-dependent oxidoreductase YjgC [Sporohalobacter salinus]|nr:putative molibdopterin-dependent oxidoreductase YjgC [Sporohalobacter salinus]